MDRTGIGLLLVCLLCVSPCVLGQDMVNIALGKTYSQISLYDRLRPASHAANNNTGGTYNQNNCIHTAVGFNNSPSPYNTYHWWEVDLGRTYPVHDITVWARDNLNRRLYPFTITVDGQTCVTVPASEAPTGSVRQKSVTCASVMYGQRVRITLQSYAHTLNLCEFQVFVPSGVNQCYAGFWGTACGQTCSKNCGGGSGKNFCYQGDGVCYGCVPGWYGGQCNDVCQSSNCQNNQCDQTTGLCADCAPGFYNLPWCTTPCRSTNCQNNQCDKTSGLCLSCPTQLDGDLCQECVPGQYSTRCNTPCLSSTCLNNKCDRNTGRCTACPQNFEGDLCTECVPGKYGGRCHLSCQSSSCLNNRCDKTSGLCTHCLQNFVGDRCLECVSGKHGADCNTICPSSNCLNNKCYKNTGHCIDCPQNFEGDLCTGCVPGKYGAQCRVTCRSQRCLYGRCNKATGWCDTCSPGLDGNDCSACRDKTYGHNCSEGCGHCKGGQLCNTTTGECTAGCQPGYSGALCKTKCEAGLYGERCNETCGHCQFNTTCHHEDGHCLAGCVADFTGPMCSQEAKPATSQENKDDGATKLVGPIVGSIVGVGLVMTISVTAAICWRRKSATSRSSGQDPPTASSISVKDAAPTVSPEPSPLRQSSSNEDNLYSEIRDPDDTYEISEMQSIYDKPSPYSNDDGDREPYMQLTLKTNDVNMPASNAAYVNTKLSV